MKKKFIIFLILFTIFILPLKTFAFNDVSSTPLNTALDDLVRFEIINGNPDGTFRPDNNISRAEFSKIIIELIKPEYEMNDGTQKFPDVSKAHWAYNYINEAGEIGIINGYPNGSFGPNDNITYEQATKMLIEAISYGRFALEKGGYPDGYIKVATENGIMRGVICNYKDVATRSNIALMARNTLDVPLLAVETIDGQAYLRQSNNTLYQIYSDFYPVE